MARGGGEDMRLVGIFIVCLAAFDASAQTWNPFSNRGKVFAKSDYFSYFTAGTYQIESPTNGTVGLLVCLGRSTAKGDQLPNMKSTTLQVGDRRDPRSPHPYMKVSGRSLDVDPVWDEARKAATYEVSTLVFDDNWRQSRVWLSNDKAIAIGKTDVSVGSLRSYYEQIAKSSGLDPQAAYASFRNTVIGRWSVQCFHLKASAYEVECQSSRVGSATVQIMRYKRDAGVS